MSVAKICSCLWSMLRALACADMQDRDISGADVRIVRGWRFLQRGIPMLGRSIGSEQGGSVL